MIFFYCVPALRSFSEAVPRKGLEPLGSCDRWHLKPVRLPIPPPRQFVILSFMKDPQGILRKAQNDREKEKIRRSKREGLFM